MAFDLGATPEEIVQRYPTLNLASVYAVIAFVLQHRDTVNGYLADREKRRAETKEEAEKRFPGMELRARLLARRAERR